MLARLNRGRVYPSYDRLPEKTALGRATIAPALDALEDAGLLVRQRRFRCVEGEGGDRAGNRPPTLTAQRCLRASWRYCRAGFAQHRLPRMSPSVSVTRPRKWRGCGDSSRTVDWPRRCYRARSLVHSRGWDAQSTRVRSTRSVSLTMILKRVPNLLNQGKIGCRSYGPTHDINAKNGKR